MRTKLFLLIINSFLINYESLGQCCPAIFSIAINPANPTVNDSILIMTRTGTTGWGTKVNKNHYVRNDTVFLEGCYITGPGAAPREYDDTFNIGSLVEGKYTIFFRAKLSSKLDTCKVIDFEDSIKSFYIKNANIASTPKPLIKVYPNPFNTHLSIKGKEVERVLISTLNGKIVMRQSFIEMNEPLLDLQLLPNSIYIIEWTGKDGNIYREKIMKE